MPGHRVIYTVHLYFTLVKFLSSCMVFTKVCTPDEVCNIQETWVRLLLILPTFSEVYYCVRTIKNSTFISKLKTKPSLINISRENMENIFNTVTPEIAYHGKNRVLTSISLKSSHRTFNNRPRQF